MHALQRRLGVLGVNCVLIHPSVAHVRATEESVCFVWQYAWTRVAWKYVKAYAALHSATQSACQINTRNPSGMFRNIAGYFKRVRTLCDDNSPAEPAHAVIDGSWVHCCMRALA